MIAAAFFAMELKVALDVVSCPGDGYVYHTFEPDKGPAQSKLPSKHVAPEVETNVSQQFPKQNETVVTQTKQAYHFTQPRQHFTQTDQSRLTIMDFLEAEDADEETRVGHFATTISPLFSKDLRNFLRWSDQVAGTAQNSRLISTHSCPRHYNGFIGHVSGARKRGQDLLCFASNQRITTPLPVVYSHNQIKNISTHPKLACSVDPEIVDALPIVSTPSVRPVVRSAQSSQKSLKELHSAKPLESSEWDIFFTPSNLHIAATDIVGSPTGPFVRNPNTGGYFHVSPHSSLPPNSTSLQKSSRIIKLNHFFTMLPPSNIYILLVKLCKIFLLFPPSWSSRMLLPMLKLSIIVIFCSKRFNPNKLNHPKQSQLSNFYTFLNSQNFQTF